LRTCEDSFEIQNLVYFVVTTESEVARKMLEPTRCIQKFSDWFH